MAKLAALRHAFRRTATNEVASSVATDDIAPNEPLQEMTGKTKTDIKVISTADETGDSASISGKETQNAENMQRGVQEVDAVTQTWSKQSLIAAFLL
jgi:hypothetical protein